MKSKKNPNVEIGRNSSLYFAIGLNMMLLISWLALEHKTYKKVRVDANTDYKEVIYVKEDIEEEIPIISYAVQSAAPPPPAVVAESINIVEDNAVVEETFIESSEVSQSTAINVYQDDATTTTAVVKVEDIEIEDIEEDVEVPFAIIEDAPIFPGCEGLYRDKLKGCFQEKIQAHIRNQFNYPQTALDFGIQGRVSVVFTIDSNGFITNIRSRGPDRLLEEEAERIIRLLPKMEPGKQRGKPVKVTYAIPIFFKYSEQ